MAQIELSLSEILTLEAELNGFINPQTGEKIIDGLMKQKLGLGMKYRLTKLSEELKAEKVILDGLRDDLIKEYGEEVDGQISINAFEDEERTKINPKFIEFQDKYGELLLEKKEIIYSPIPLSDIESIVSDDTYNVLFKLVQE
jgi:uncharacterized membrane protein YheB (UPF0754 family)